jgi:hypothetical protein
MFITIFACGALSAMPISAALSKDKLPEISSDGLHLLKHTKARAVYTKPGATFDQYTKVKILDCFVQFKKNWEKDYNMNEVGLEGRVTNKDAVAIKKGLAAEFTKVFTKQLEKHGHPVVDDVGPDVLLLRPAIINLDVTAPDLMTPGMSSNWVSSAGEMTLYMELYDSATSELLARVIDPEADRSMGAMAANRVTNTAAADRIISRWAELLSNHLGDIKKTTATN